MITLSLHDTAGHLDGRKVNLLSRDGSQWCTGGVGSSPFSSKSWLRNKWKCSRSYRDQYRELANDSETYDTVFVNRATPSGNKIMIKIIIAQNCDGS